MFLLMQYSAFDFRVLQSPDVLVSPIRSWPQVQANQEFINNFGLIRESYKSVLSPYLLPEDNLYVDCRNSIKFPEENPKEAPVDIYVKMRRMLFDGRGGVKLLIGMVLDFGRHIPFMDLEEALDFALQTKIRISAPGQISKKVSLAKLSAPFKNIYAHSSSLSQGEEAQKNLIRKQNPLLLLDMSQREFEHFLPEKKYEEFFFQRGLKLYYSRNRLAGTYIDSFLTLNVDTTALNRLTKYYLSQLNAYVENLKSMMHFYKFGETFSERAKIEFSHTYEVVFGNKLPEHWQDLYNMYQSLFAKQLELIQQEPFQNLILSTSSEPDKQREKLINTLVKKGIEMTFPMAKSMEEVFDIEEMQGLLMLETRYNRTVREELEGVTNTEELRIERNRISSALLKLFRSV